MQIEENDFFQIQSKLGSVYFTQSRGWHNYWKKRGYDIHYFVDDINNSNICAWGIVSKIPLVGEILRIEGETYRNDIKNITITSFFDGILTNGYAGVLVISNSRYSLEFEVGIRRSGYFRPLLMTSCPLTIVVDIANDVSYNRNWKREYNKAIKSNLLFNIIDNPTKKDLEYFHLLINDLNERKKIHVSFTIDAIETLFKSGSYKLFYVTDKDGNVLAGRIIYIHDINSFDVLAANSNASLAFGTSYFLVQSIFEYLKSEGVVSFDFGRVSPSKSDADGIFQFKRKVKGDLVQYNGDWVKFKNNWIEFLYSFYMFAFKSSKRY